MGLFVATSFLRWPAQNVCLPKFESDPEVLQARKPKATAMMGIPTFYTRL